MANVLPNTVVEGKDTPGSQLPFQVHSLNTADDFANNATWGRVIRLIRGSSGEGMYFDIGLNANGDLFINRPANNASMHVLTITRGGEVHITGKLFVNGNPIT